MISARFEPPRGVGDQDPGRRRDSREGRRVIGVGALGRSRLAQKPGHEFGRPRGGGVAAIGTGAAGSSPEPSSSPAGVRTSSSSAVRTWA